MEIRNKIIWENIELLMKDKNITSFVDLGRMVGTRPQHINELKQGLKGFGKVTLKKFAEGLGVEEYFLLVPSKEIIDNSDSLPSNSFTSLIQYLKESVKDDDKKLLKDIIKDLKNDKKKLETENQQLKRELKQLIAYKKAQDSQKRRDDPESFNPHKERKTG